MQGDTGRFHPSPTSSVHPEHLQYFDLAGRLAGLAAREGATLPAPLSLPGATLHLCWRHEPRAVWQYVRRRISAFSSVTLCNTSVYL